MLAENNPKHSNFCYNNSLYDLCPIPFYGEYNDYGAVEECHGTGLTYVVEAIRKKLYEFGQGPNEYHDCEVRKDSFDIEKLFEADHEDRLFIEHYPYRYNPDEYDINQFKEEIGKGNQLTESQQFELDRLANTITRKVDPRRRVTHVIIHGDIFDYIVKNWYIEEYVGAGAGNTGYNNSYIRLYFSDLEASIPEAVERIKGVWTDDNKDNSKKWSVGISGFRSIFDWDDRCPAGRALMSLTSSGGSITYSLIDVAEVIPQLADDGKWDEIAAFIKEAMVGYWMNAYMSFTRKLWSKQGGSGSQNSDHLGYKVLAEGVLEVLKAERAEYDMDEEEGIDETEDDGNQTVS